MRKAFVAVRVSVFVVRGQSRVRACASTACFACVRVCFCVSEYMLVSCVKYA